MKKRRLKKAVFFFSLKFQAEHVLAFRRNFVRFIQLRSAGVRAYAPHCNVQTNVDEIVFRQFEIVLRFYKLRRRVGIDGEGERRVCRYGEQVLYAKVFACIMAALYIRHN